MATHTVVLDTLTLHDQPIGKSIVNANPDAADGTLNAFVTKLNALTTNNLITATRVVKTNLDEPPVVQTTPTLTLAQTSINWTDIKDLRAKLIDITYTGDGTLDVDACINCVEMGNAERNWSSKIVYVDGAPKLWLCGAYACGSYGHNKGKVFASETPASAPVEVEFTITE